MPESKDPDVLNTDAAPRHCLLNLLRNRYIPARIRANEIFSAAGAGESHIAAVAIALLLVWAVAALVSGLWYPVYRIVSYIIEAIAILDIPSSSVFMLDMTEGLVVLAMSLTYVVFAFFYVLAAWIIARWIYGTMPLRVLTKYASKIRAKNYAPQT
jgi:hypothetical protein